MNSAFFAVTVLTVILLNIYPRIYTKRLLCIATENSAKMFTDNVAEHISDYYNASGYVDTVLGQGSRRIILTDPSGLIIFDSAKEYNRTGSYLLTKEIIRALDGEEHLDTRLEHRRFTSEIIRPIYKNGELYGVITVLSYDFEATDEYNRTCSVFFFISLLIGLLPFVAAAIISRDFSKKTADVYRGIQKIQERKYGQKIGLSSNDTFGQLAQGIDLASMKLREYDETTRRFVSDASHELKTPLASIKLLSDSILQTPNMDRESVNEFLTDINQEIDRLTRISTRLLNLTKLDGTASADVFTERLDLAAVATTVCRMLTPLAKSTGCTIRTEFSSNCFIDANYDSVYQILYNLIENSIKYGGEGKEVRAFIFPRDDRIVFIIDDDGEGIPQSDLNKIFERFYRVDKARSRATGGTGLGLSIVASAVELCRGSVSVVNRPDGGARFTVSFPVAQEGDRQ